MVISHLQHQVRLQWLLIILTLHPLVIPLKLEELKKKYSVIEEVRGMGVMRALKLSVPSDPYAAEALKQGLIINSTQGDVLRIGPGDCFIQPPGIRHRVLHSEGVQVVEIGVPAQHVTEIDHEMRLPTPHYRPEREWEGQRFVHSLAVDGIYNPHRISGYQARDTHIAANTRGVAGVVVARPIISGVSSPWVQHKGDILFSFVLSGHMRLEGKGKEPYDLTAGDAFVIPPYLPTRYCAPSADLQILEVALPADPITVGLEKRGEREGHCPSRACRERPRIFLKRRSKGP
jgi:quercetin dioxygenase-like cupin family protein